MAVRRVRVSRDGASHDVGWEAVTRRDGSGERTDHAGVSDALRQLFHSPSLDIAEPGAEFQGGNVLTWRVALFHWGPDATRFEWGSAAPGGLVGIDDVRKAILSRRITSPDRLW